MLFTLLATLLPLAAASPLWARQNATTPATSSSNSTSANSTTTSSAPKVTITPSGSNGQVVQLTGISYPSFGQDVYLGIPFAQPPVGDLRFVAPQGYVYNASSFNATQLAPACLQDPSGSLAGSAGISEDCLFLNVYTPEGYSQDSAPLPVMVWIYGGAFIEGATSTYNATVLMAQGIQSKKPVIYVSVAYRLGIFGWGNGNGVADNGAANLGLRDITAGLQWVQDNIWAFGGDPTRVTVFGQSAGAISISLLYLNTNQNLFSGAIMESGAQSTTPLGPTATTWQSAYDLLLSITGCGGNATSASNSTSTNVTTTNSTASSGSSGDGFACLKALNATTLLNATLLVQSQIPGFVYSPSVDGDLIPDSPHTLLQQGKFAQIPFISGNVVDEGTSFVEVYVSNETVVGGYIDALEKPNEPSLSLLEQLLTLYPDVPSLGSPYNTGNNTFGLTPEFKQLASIIGDGTFQANRRYFLQQAQAQGLSKTWSYLWTEPILGANASLGVQHSSEVYYVYGLVQEASGYSDVQKLLSQQVIDYWLNFAYYSDPNGAGGDVISNVTSAYWPSYGMNASMLQFATGNNSVISDTYRQQGMEFFLNNPTSFNYRR